MSNQLRILGIDPGSRLTGYAIVDLSKNSTQQSQLKIITHGTLMLQFSEKENAKREEDAPFEVRLFRLFERLSIIITEFNPTHVAIEKVFFAKNPVSALKLGQARGAALVCSVHHGLKVFEYAATEVKSAIVGHGRADKEQVSKMLERIFGTQDFKTFDASDALAVATCHAQLMKSNVLSHKRSENKSLSTYMNEVTTRKPKKTQRMADALGIKPEDVAGKKRIRL